MEDWDIISTKDVIGSEQHLVERTKTLASAALPFTQSILSQVHPGFSRTGAVQPARGLTSAFACAKVGRTLSRVQQALSWSYEEEMKPFMPPLSDAEFHSYLNGQGQLTRPEELRLRIYHGGVEPSLRKVQHHGFRSSPYGGDPRAVGDTLRPGEPFNPAQRAPQSFLQKRDCLQKGSGSPPPLP